METLVAATKLNGQIMGLGNELGMIQESYLAGPLLVDGMHDPIHGWIHGRRIRPCRTETA
ncbi:hypothetical protein FZ942_19480 [Azospirillum lipoferum]|uniref:Uncharacterized protein n=1 Tax=Azospirillum lipoferum TaxID=193 RepID=A0A5A9GKX0_AZOLI|nr:hypothetical protein FZ942_19480 [Azospirillum lipoferum]